MLEHIKPNSLMIGDIHAGVIHEIFHQSTHRFRDLDGSNLQVLNSFSSAQGPFHESNRNKIVNFAMARPKVEWLLFIDTDIEWAPEVPYQLLNVADDKEHRIITGLYFGKPGTSEQWLPQWYNLNQDNEFVITERLEGDPLQRIDGAGMGICLIHMSVFRDFPEIDHDWRWFGRDPWRVNGKIEHLGEDLTFFLRLNRLCLPDYERWTSLPPNKIPIWGHRGVVVKHHKEQAIGLEEFLAQKNTLGKISVASLETDSKIDGPRIIRIND